MRTVSQPRDLTSGPAGRQLLLFALPLLGSSLIQQLYNTVDLFFVGNLLGKDSMAAVGASSLLTSCMVGFFTGLAVGTGVIMAQAQGEKNSKKIRQIVHTAMGISFAGSVLLTILGLLLSRPILLLMHTPAGILEEGLLYIRIYLLSMLPLFLYNMNSGIIRARGDSRTPMFLQLLGASLNIVLDWISMGILGMGVEGAAWATLISQAAAALGTLVYLMRQKDAYHLYWSRIRITSGVLKAVLRIGIPAGLQNLVITISNIFVQTAINHQGVVAITAFTAYFKVELILYLPIVAFGQAVTTFTGQNYGAEKTDRIRKGIRAGLLIGMIYTALMAMLMLALGQTAFGLFNQDPAVIAVGQRIIRVTFPFYWLYAILEMHGDALRGIGQSVTPMVLILFCMCVLRTGMLFLFQQIWGTLEAVAAVYPCAWLAGAVCLVLAWKKSYNKLRSVSGETGDAA